MGYEPFQDFWMQNGKKKGDVKRCHIDSMGVF